MGHSGMNVTAEWAAVLVAGIAAVASLSNVFYTNKVKLEVSRIREWGLTTFVSKTDFLNLMHMLKPGKLNDGADE